MDWQVVEGDVLEWAAGYEGEPFHAIMCDPPYHLTSITKRFGDKDSAPAQYGKDGAFQRVSRGFMGSKWDGGDIAFRPETWAALAEHLLPGGFGMVFASSRGWHRLAVAIEDAGLRIHPSIFCWVQGQGFPKATNIHVQLEKRLCYQDEEKDWFYKDDDEPMRTEPPFRHPDADRFYGHRYGGQVLAPKVEPIIVFQKPYQGRPVDSITATGAGAMWIDGARIGTEPISAHGGGQDQERIYGMGKGFPAIDRGTNPHQGRWPANFALCHNAPRPCPACGGRTYDTWETWYAKTKPYGGTREEWERLSHGADTLECGYCGGTGLVGGCRGVGTKQVKGSLDGTRTGGIWQTGGKETVRKGHADADGTETVAAYQCEAGCPVREIGEQSGVRKSGARTGGDAYKLGRFEGQEGAYGLKVGGTCESSTGTAIRFYFNADWHYETAERLAAATPVRYQAKSSRRERDAGLIDFIPHVVQTGCAGAFPIDDQGKERDRFKAIVRNSHPCCKPIDLCRWLATLLLPPPEYAPRRILVPFAGSGSEGIGAMLAGFEEIVMIEQSIEYCRISEARVKFWSQFDSYEDAMETAKDIQEEREHRENMAKNGQVVLDLW